MITDSKNKPNVKAADDRSGQPRNTRVDSRGNQVLTKAFHFSGLPCLYLGT